MSQESDNESTELSYDVSIGGSRERWTYQEDPAAQIRVTPMLVPDEATESMATEANLSASLRSDSNIHVGYRSTKPAPVVGEAGRIVIGLTRRTIVPPKSGDVVADRYRVVRVLGEGGMGQVFEVAHIRLGKSFALKLLKPSMVEDKEMCRAFFREARYASSLEHPNLVSVLDYGEDIKFGGYMVMELASGQSLKDFLARRGKLNVKKACDIVSQVADALLYMHQNELIHCDLKPDNIVLVPNEGVGRKRNIVKLLDFGLAQSVGGVQREGIFGTPKYLAPEIALRDVPGPAADIYSLGILLFELLVGKVPWTGNARKIVRNHLRSTPPTLTEASGSEIDSALEQLVATALRKRPEERHKDMSAFIYELKNFMQMMGMESTRRARPTAAPQKDEADVRLRNACLGFDALHLPLATIVRDGTIMAANAAFSQFLLGIRVGLEGTRLQETALASAWPSLSLDLESAFRGNALGRHVEFKVGDQVQRHKMWLEPTRASGHVVLSMYPEG